MASLRSRLLRLLLAPLLLLFALGGVISYMYALHYANWVYDGWLYDSANSLALVVERGPAGPVLDLPQPALQLFEWDVADTTYYKVSGSRSGFIGGRADLPPAPVRAAVYQNARVYNGTVDGRPVRIVSLELPQAPLGETVLVQVAETNHKRDQLARRILLGVMLPQLLLIAVGGAVLWFGIQSGLAPLATVTRQLQAQDLQRLRPVAAEAIPLEVRPLARALNELLGKLELTASAQRRFIADAAHQLRTPVTALKLDLEQALQENGYEGLRAALPRVEQGVQRLSRLSNQLLLLARAEPEAAEAMTLETLDLAALAAEVGAEWAPRALARGIELSLASPVPSVRVLGNRTLLTEALNNLIDNAVKYRGGPGEIALEVTARPQPAVAVADDGPGIPPPRREDALKRFHRLDRRGRDGSGLGLAIVQEIVKAHGAELALEEGLHGRGLRVRMSFAAMPTSG